LSVLIVRLLGGRLRWPEIRVVRKSGPLAAPDPACRMSQSCYEVRDQVD